MGLIGEMTGVLKDIESGFTIQELQELEGSIEER